MTNKIFKIQIKLMIKEMLKQLINRDKEFMLRHSLVLNDNNLYLRKIGDKNQYSS